MGLAHEHLKFCIEKLLSYSINNIIKRETETWTSRKTSRKGTSRCFVTVSMGHPMFILHQQLTRSGKKLQLSTYLAAEN